MAVYKASQCYPFLNSIDARVNTNDDPVCLSCRVDTSNKKITGYNIKLLDSKNNVIFTPGLDTGEASPISELEQDGSVNTGINGTYLKIPFIQNKLSTNKTVSYNSIYYKGTDTADLAIIGGSLSSLPSSRTWDGMIDGVAVSVGMRVLTVGTDCLIFLYQGRNSTREPQWELVETYNSSSLIYVRYGNTYGKSVRYGSSLSVNTDPMWEDYNGNDIIGLTQGDDSSYKWIIVLYQGSAEIMGSAPSKIQYANIDLMEYDAIVTQGTILGSTNNRIQIDPTDQIYPQLFVQLVTNDGNNANSSRAPINSYDSTYGHIYPQEGWFTEDQIASVDITKVKIYKHSNSEEYIDASDIVDCATNTFCELNSSTTTIDGHTLSNGEYVLVMHQGDEDFVRAKENGVYVVSTDTSNGQPIAWKRAGSYDEWGDFIGKIFFVRYGSQGGRNFVSQAKAGGTLYTTTAETADSVLLFSEEEPVIIYPQNIKYSVDLYDRYYSSSSPYGGLPTDAMDSVDGYPIIEGMTALSPTHGIFKASISGTTVTWTESANWEGNVSSLYNANSKYKVILGIDYGGDKVYLGSGARDFSSQIANIHKNNVTTVDGVDIATAYIKPSVGINPGMKFFLDSPQAKYNDDSVLYDNITITSIDTKNWCVTYTPATKPFDSFIKSGYKIKTYFKGSDENVVYLKDLPQSYISVYNGITGAQESINALETPEELYFNKDDEIIAISVGKSVTVAARMLHVSGLYKQLQGSSWSNYRWMLSDSLGTIIQDTGKIYAGDLSTVFYGLGNDGLDEGNIYYAIIQIEDSNGIQLIDGIKVFVAASTSDLCVPFTANFDYHNQAVYLQYSTIDSLYPTVALHNASSALDGNYSITKYNQYISGIPSIIYFEGQLSADSVAGVFSVMGKNGWSAEWNDWSLISNYGLWYPIGYGNQAHSYKFEDALPTQQPDTGEYMVQIQFELDDNFSGSILSDKQFCVFIPPDAGIITDSDVTNIEPAVASSNGKYNSIWCEINGVSFPLLGDQNSEVTLFNSAARSCQMYFVQPESLNKYGDYNNYQGHFNFQNQAFLNLPAGRTLPDLWGNTNIIEVYGDITTTPWTIHRGDPTGIVMNPDETVYYRMTIAGRSTGLYFYTSASQTFELLLQPTPVFLPDDYCDISSASERTLTWLRNTYGDYDPEFKTFSGYHFIDKYHTPLTSKYYLGRCGLFTQAEIDSGNCSSGIILEQSLTPVTSSTEGSLRNFVPVTYNQQVNINGVLRSFPILAEGLQNEIQWPSENEEDDYIWYENTVVPFGEPIVYKHLPEAYSHKLYTLAVRIYDDVLPDLAENNYETIKQEAIETYESSSHTPAKYAELLSSLDLSSTLQSLLSSAHSIYDFVGATTLQEDGSTTYSTTCYLVGDTGHETPKIKIELNVRQGV